MVTQAASLLNWRWSYNLSYYTVLICTLILVLSPHHHHGNCSFALPSSLPIGPSTTMCWPRRSNSLYTCRNKADSPPLHAFQAKGQTQGPPKKNGTICLSKIIFYLVSSIIYWKCSKSCGCIMLIINHYHHKFYYTVPCAYVIWFLVSILKLLDSLL